MEKNVQVKYEIHLFISLTLSIVISGAVREDPSSPSRRTYTNVLAAFQRDGGNAEDILEYFRVRPAMNRIRAGLMPRIPRDIQDVDVNGVWARTWSGQDYLLVEDNDRGHLIFATDDDLRILRRCPDLFMDATFSTCPDPPYKQYFTIHGRYNGRTMCLVSALMNGKLLIFKQL